MIKHSSIYIPVIILLSSVLVTGAFAQVEALAIPDEADRNHKRTFYTYDDTQRKTEYVEQRWLAGGAWGNQRRQTFEHEDDGRTVVMLDQYWQGGIWNNANREISTYDTETNLTSRTREEWLGDGEWRPERRDIYTYDEDNRKTEWRSQLRTEDGNWYYTWRFTYAYDDEDYITEILFEEWSRNGWETVRRITDEYSDNRTRRERIIFESRRGSVNPVKAYRYEYNDTTGEMIRQITRQRSRDTWVDVTEERYTYDDEGRITETIFRDLRANAGGRTIAQETYNYQDEEEVKTERIRREQVDDGDLQEVWRYVYSYDFRGYKTTKSFSRFSEDAWVEAERTTYTYDIYGNVTSSVTQQ